MAARRIADCAARPPRQPETEKTEENVRCVMGHYQGCYIVNLTVILDSVLRTAAGNETENAALRD